MPINRIADPLDNPETVADWQKISNIFQTTWLAITGSLKIVGSVIQKGSAVCIGGKWYVASADTAITGTASEYVKLTDDGETVVAEFVADIADVFWSQSWNGFYDAFGSMYLFDEVKAYGAGAIATMHSITNWRPRGTEAAKALSQPFGAGWAALLGQAPTPEGKTYTLAYVGGGLYNYAKSGSGACPFGGFTKIGQVTMQTKRGVILNATSLRAVTNVPLLASVDFEIREGATVLAAFDEDTPDIGFVVGGQITGTARVLEVFARSTSGATVNVTFAISGTLTITEPSIFDDYYIRSAGGVLS